MEAPSQPKFWVAVPPTPGTSKSAPSKSSGSQTARLKINKRLASLAANQAGPELALESYPTPDSSGRPTSLATNSARSSSPEVVIVSQHNNWRPPRPSFVNSDHEGSIATCRASRLPQQPARLSPCVGTKYPHGTLVAVEHWIGVVCLVSTFFCSTNRQYADLNILRSGWQVWDRKWAEADWFGPKICNPEPKNRPDSLVVVSVRKGCDW